MLCCVPLETASRLLHLKISQLQKKSDLIVIGKVTNVLLLKDNGMGGKAYTIQIKTISTLKSSEDIKEINLTLRRGGVRGFNVIPKPNTFWTIFLKKSTGTGWQLVHPRSMAKFETTVKEEKL